MGLIAVLHCSCFKANCHEFQVACYQSQQKFVLLAVQREDAEAMGKASAARCTACMLL